MSIIGMADNAVAAQAAAETDDAPRGVPTNVVNQLVVYIPTEIITVWVAYLALVDDPRPPDGKGICHADFSNRWVAVLVFAAVAAALAIGFAYRKSRDAEVSFKWPWFEAAAAPFAFVAWAVALPESPLRSACWFDDEAGAFIILVATVALTTLAYILGRAKRFEKAAA